MEWTATNHRMPGYAASIIARELIPGRLTYTYILTQQGVIRESDWTSTLINAKRLIARQTYPGWKWIEP